MPTDTENNSASVQASTAHQNSPDGATAYTTHRQPLLQRFSEKYINRRAPDVSRNRRERAFITSWWWWWEIGGAIVALVFFFTIIAILKLIDGTRTEDWHRNIQPAALLSVFTTVGKIGLMFVVASCMSQLKWMHYKKPNRLSHLDVFDEASRAGPWSNAMMFVKVRTGLIRTVPNFLIALFALITLASFAIEPMIQQVVDTPQREIEMPDINVAIMTNNGYISLAKTEREDFETHNSRKGKMPDEFRLLTLISTSVSGAPSLFQQSDFLRQLLNTSLQPDIHCPSNLTRCEFNNITMLGLCSEHLDITDRTDRKCTQKPVKNRTDSTLAKNSIECSFEMKRDDPQYVEVLRNDGLTISFGAGDGHTYENFRSILDKFANTDTRQYKEKRVDMARLFTIRVVGDDPGKAFLDQVATEDEPLQVPATQVTLTNWYWCQQNYTRVSVEAGNSSISGTNNVTTAPLLLYAAEDFEWSFITQEQHDQFQNGVSDDKLTKHQVTDFIWQNFYTLLGPFVDVKWMQFLDSNEPKAQLRPQVSTGLNTVDPATQPDKAYVGDAIGIAPFMVGADLEQLAKNIATAVTNQVQQSAHNSDTNTTNGTAWATETFYHVRWGWITLPLLQAVAAFLLLIVTIFLNTLPVLRSTNVGLLAHGPEDAVAYRVSGVETVDKWEKFSEGIDVVLADDERGWMRLTRV